jgi:hypothetical protein
MAPSHRYCWPPRLRIPQAPRGRVCGWVLLALLPEARQSPENQCGVLAKEARWECCPRSRGKPVTSQGRLACDPNLGTRPPKAR